MSYRVSFPAISALAGLALATAASAAPMVSWNGANAIVDDATNRTTLFETTVPDGATYGRLIWNPAKGKGATPGISVDNVNAPGMPPGSTGCVVTGGAACNDPRQSGKRFRVQATDYGPIDILFDYADDNGVPPGTVSGIYRLFGKVINFTSKAMKGYSIELGTGVGNQFTPLSGSEGVTFYPPMNTPPRNFELASFFPPPVFGPEGRPLPTSPQGLLSDQSAGFNMKFSPTKVETTSMFGDYSSLFGFGMMPRSAVPEGYFFDDDNDPTTEANLQAWFDPASGAWLFGDEGGFTLVSAATLSAWAANPLYSIGPIGELANNNFNVSIQFQDAPPGQMTMRVTPEPVPVPAGVVLLGSVVVAGGVLARRCRRPIARN